MTINSVLLFTAQRRRWDPGFGDSLFILVALMIFTSCSGRTDNRAKPGNDVTVQVSDGLSTNKIKIQLGYYSMNAASDLVLVKAGLEKPVFDGGAKHDFETICGENDFLLLYDNTYYTIVRHFIPNDFVDAVPPPHRYHFSFRKAGDQSVVTVKVEGELSETFERQLQQIDQAGSNRWGKPLTAK